MTYIDDSPPPAADPSAQAPWDSCDHCQAPLAEGQRYCVVCGSRRAQADDPAARYFVDATRRARSGALAAAPAPRQPDARQGLKTAALLALLPIVAAIGIVIGRNGANDDQLLEALKAQKAPIVNVGAGGTAAASDEGDDDAGGGSKDKGSDPADGKVLNRTAYGSARQLTGAKATPEQLEESEEALEKIVENKGKEYVEQQRGLPDQIIIP